MKTTFLFFLSVFLYSSFLNAQNKVLIIGIDGCKPDALIKANTPNLDKLWKNGAYSFNTKTDEISSSGICWTSMLTGVWHEKHKVLTNSYKNPNIKEYPHFYTRVQNENPALKTYSIVNWGPIHKILQPNDADVVKSSLTDKNVTSRVVRTLKKKDVDVLFVQLDNVDHAGHKYDFSVKSEKYLTAIELADMQIGKMINALESRKNYANENWLILVSTDHGGSEFGHGKNIPEHTTTFFIASGSTDVQKGKIEKQVYVVDIAVTALKHLGIDIKEEWKLDGKVSGLK